MWPTPVVLCVAVMTAQALVQTWSIEGTAGLFFLMENLQWTYLTVTCLMASTAVGSALCAMAVAPWMDQVDGPALALGAAVASTLTRMAMATTATFLSHPTLIQGYGPAIASMAIIIVQVLDQAIVDTWLWLAIDRTIESSLLNDHRRLRRRVWGAAYSAGNVVMALGLVVYDMLRTHAPIPAVANSMSLWLGTAVSILSLLILLLLFRHRPNSPRTRSAVHVFLTSPSSSEGEDTVVTTPEKSLWRDLYFWRFVIFMLLLMGVSSLFRHMNETLPLVLRRLYTDRVHFALVQAINPVLISFLAPWLQSVTDERPSYWVIAGGSAVSSAAVLALVADGSHSDTRRWPLHEASFVEYLPYLIFMIVFSVGEALWSARVSAYTLEVAPRHRKATYRAAARLPVLGARLILAWHAWFLLQQYCPDPWCHPQPLWLVVWLFTAITPVTLVVFFHWVRPERPDRTVSSPTSASAALVNSFFPL